MEDSASNQTVTVSNQAEIDCLFSLAEASNTSYSINELEVSNYTNQTLSTSVQLEDAEAISRSEYFTVNKSFIITASDNLESISLTQYMSFGDSSFVVENLPNLTHLDIGGFLLYPQNFTLRNVPKLAKGVTNFRGFSPYGRLTLENTGMDSFSSTFQNTSWALNGHSIDPILSITIANNGFSDISIPTVVDIMESLKISNPGTKSQPWVNITLESLEISGTIEFGGVKSLSLPGLRASGSFAIRNSPITDVALSVLTTVGGDITIEAPLKSLDLGLLERVDGHMNITITNGGTMNCSAIEKGFIARGFQQRNITCFDGTVLSNVAGHDGSTANGTDSSEPPGSKSRSATTAKAKTIGGLVVGIVLFITFLSILCALHQKRWNPKRRRLVRRVKTWRAELSHRPRPMTVLVEAQGDFASPVELEADTAVYEVEGSRAREGTLRAQGLEVVQIRDSEVPNVLRAGSQETSSVQDRPLP